MSIKPEYTHTFGLAFPLLGTCPTETHTYVYRNTCSRMFMDSSIICYSPKLKAPQQSGKIGCDVTMLWNTKHQSKRGTSAKSKNPGAEGCLRSDAASARTAALSMELGLRV